MKTYSVLAALGALLGAASFAQAQTAPLPPGPLEKLQDDFGAIVGNAFHAPDPVINAPDATAPNAPGPTLGRALRASNEIPGAVFAGLMKPLADADATPAPAPGPAPRRVRHARLHHHRAPAQG